MKEETEWFNCPFDPHPDSKRDEVGRASEDELAELHGATAHELSRMVKYGNMRTKLAAISHSIKFLKDNNITASLKASGGTKALLKNLPTAEELERIMQNSPSF
jgi:hypothetical protein